MSDELYLNPFSLENNNNSQIFGDLSEYTDEALLEALQWYSYPDWNCYYSYIDYKLRIDHCLTVNNDRYHKYQDILDELEMRNYDIAEYEEPHQYIALAEFLQTISKFENLSQTTDSNPERPLSPFEKAYLRSFLDKEKIALRDLDVFDDDTMSD
jgi:hypothetical protein